VTFHDSPSATSELILRTV